MEEGEGGDEDEDEGSYMIPITVATIALIHERSGFTKDGD